ncbi:MAG TPA: LPS export ABC transporter periplasmic protein LptC [Gammaproteobacteria bacterium]|jgi:lipopolysaccharide export system protein LptC|nr:LPS export ABC transporter periplasmic protein LptC [Gammaproteobacteria bacterium]
MTYKNTFISIAVLITIGFALSTMLFFSRSQNIYHPKQQQQPDAIMEGVTALIMNKSGKPNMKIVTPKLVHYMENNTSHLTTPHLTIYRDSPQPWHVTSQHAKALHGTDQVEFWENVVIRHAADTRHPATVIKTTTLTVHPNEHTAQTDEFITLTQPNLIVKATGMHANMSTGDVRLLSEARGEYVPEA